MSVTRIKRGDTRPLEATLTANGQAVPLAGADVLFLMEPFTPGLGSIVSRAAEIMDEDGGEVRVVWEDEDVDSSGHHRAEFEVTSADGTKETFPTDGYLHIEIVSDLG